MKYYKNTNNETFVDPILANHTGLVEITESEFLAIANPPKTVEQIQAELIASGEALVEAHIQEPIDAYNKANGVKFKDAHSCANYKDEATYPHHLFCADAWAFNVAVWEASRAIQVQVFTEVIPQPTAEEFKAMLPVYVGVV